MGRHPRPPQPGGSHHWPPQQRHGRARPAPGAPEPSTAQVGESLRRTGRWGSHPTYGRQFQVHSYATVLPATIQGIRAYLGSGLIKGIGPVMAERMVAHFGTGILAIIEHQPGRLTEVHGLGPKRVKKIAGAWEEQKAIKE